MIHNITFKVYNNGNKCNYPRETGGKFLWLLHNVVVQTVKLCKASDQNIDIKNFVTMKHAK